VQLLLNLVGLLIREIQPQLARLSTNVLEKEKNRDLLAQA